jgi:hypothetical protein
MSDEFSDGDTTQTDPSLTDQDDLSTNTDPGLDAPIDDDQTADLGANGDSSGDQTSTDEDSGDQSSTGDQTSTDDGSGDQTSTDDGSGDQPSTGDQASTDDGSGDQSSTGDQTSTDEGGTNTIQTQQYDVPALAQPSDMTCWATVATMMISWQDSVCYEITAVMDRAGTSYRGMFDADQGLPGSQKVAFLSALTLRSEPPQDYAVVGFQRLIENYGPLWVTTDESPDENFAIHARIVTGMAGDGSVDGTMLTIIDPADGLAHTESYNDFTQKFDRVAFDDMNTGSDFRVQVVHF